MIELFEYVRTRRKIRGKTVRRERRIDSPYSRRFHDIRPTLRTTLAQGARFREGFESLSKRRNSVASDPEKTERFDVLFEHELERDRTARNS